MPGSLLACIAYVSALRDEPTREALDAMLSTWRRHNAERGITGILLYRAQSLFQILEGFPDEVRAQYAAIEADPIHRAITKLIDEPIAARSFGDWSVGHARAFRNQRGVSTSVQPVLDPAFRYWHCDEAMARSLARNFTTGPWRRAIS